MELFTRTFIVFSTESFWFLQITRVRRSGKNWCSKVFQLQFKCSALYGMKNCKVSTRSFSLNFASGRSEFHLATVFANSHGFFRFCNQVIWTIFTRSQTWFSNCTFKNCPLKEKIISTGIIPQNQVSDLQKVFCLLQKYKYKKIFNQTIHGRFSEVDLNCFLLFSVEFVAKQNACHFWTVCFWQSTLNAHHC